MASLSSLFEDWKNYQKNIEWQLGRGDDIANQNDVNAIEDWERWQGVGPGNLNGVSGLAGTFITKEMAQKIGKGHLVEKAIRRHASGENPESYWPATRSMLDQAGNWIHEISDVKGTYTPEQAYKGVLSDWERHNAILNDAKILKQNNLSLSELNKHKEEVEKFLGIPANPYNEDSMFLARNYPIEDLRDMGKSHFEIKPEEGNFTAPIEDFYLHPELQAAAPEIFRPNSFVPNLKSTLSLKPEDQMGDYRGWYEPSTGNITMSGYHGATPEGKGTMVHELQHGIQEKAGLPVGSNTGVAAEMLRKAENRDRNKYAPGFAEWKTYSEKLAPLYSAQDISRLHKLSLMENITPRRINNLSDFYQYSDDVRANLGPMPKKSGPEQKKWLRNAAAALKDKAIEAHNELVGFKTDYIRGTPLNKALSGEDLKKDISQLEKKRKPYLEDYKKYNDLTDFYKKIQGLSDFEKYRTTWGEVQARLADRRKNLTEEELSQNYPMRYDPHDFEPLGLDVDPRTIWYYK